MSELEKEKAVHDYIVLNAKYNHDSPENPFTVDNYTAYGILVKGMGECSGYANATRALLNRLGIECMTVFSVEMNHMWNIVKIDGKYYQLDTTWDDTETPGVVSHEYFNLTDSEMSQSHKWEYNPIYPVCNTTYTITNVNLNKTADALGVGGTDKLTATIAPVTSTNKIVAWTTSDATIAKVDATGKVTGINIGTATITATSVDGSQMATCNVTVDPAINLDSEFTFDASRCDFY